MKQTIEIPEGFELKKVSDTEYQIVKKEEKLPNTWDEFCKTHKMKNEYFIGTNSGIACFTGDRDTFHDRNLLPNKEYAEAILALCQLIQLRDCYRQGWKPNWNDFNAKRCICIGEDYLQTVDRIHTSEIFAFQTTELRDKFLNNFRELLITASYLWKS